MFFERLRTTHGHAVPRTQIGFGCVPIGGQHDDAPGNSLPHSAHGHVVQPRAGKYSRHVPFAQT